VVRGVRRYRWTVAAVKRLRTLGAETRGEDEGRPLGSLQKGVEATYIFDIDLVAAATALPGLHENVVSNGARGSNPWHLCTLAGSCCTYQGILAAYAE
jgi:hypothetical protein